MSSDFSPELRRELLDDFHAECAELLSALRKSLPALDALSGAVEPSADAIEALLRGVHSLKGISAIAGVGPAERVAHAMEDLLRALTRKIVPPSAERHALLAEALQLLERIIDAHRLGQPMPAIDELLAALAANSAVATETATPVTAGTPRARPADPVTVARERGRQPWRCTFVPSSALDRRGINIGAVRQRLKEAGEIMSAAPAVRPDGSVAFVFTIGLPHPPSTEEIARWEADGLHLEPIEHSSATASEQGVVLRPAELRPETPATLAPSHLVRVNLSRLDELLRIAGEMVIQRSRLEDRIREQFGGAESLKEIELALGRSLRDLRKAIARVRLVPMEEIFDRVPLVVRDLAAGSGKAVRISVEGQRTEVDKYLVERIREPLLHLVRNAFAHGVETTAERPAAGKPAEATIALRAATTGETVVIEVRDDGRGIEAAAIAARARALGLPVPSPLDEPGLLQILCAPGFSTREQPDRASGRGVGMGIVANTVRELGGTLGLSTRVGAGTTFTLRLPLTLSIYDAVLVSVGSELCAVPQSTVEEIIEVPAGEVRAIRQAEVVPYRGGLLPVQRLRKIFAMDTGSADLMTVLVLNSERGATGLAVDRLRGRREIVVRPLADPLVRVPGVAGATDLGDGRPILILDPHALTDGVVRPNVHVLEAEEPRFT